MPTIGIILCETLELEFAYLLANDVSIGSISIINNDSSGRFINKLEANGEKSIQVIPHFNSYYKESSKQINILATVLPMDLHRSRSLLRETILDLAHQISRHIDSLLLGYGLCGTGDTKSGFLADFEKPFFTLSEKDNPIDDCIGLLLGSRETYYAEQCKCPGTFYMSAGWTYHWRKMLKHTQNESEYEAIKKMFANYKRILLIKTQVLSKDKMQNNTIDFIKHINLPVEMIDGTLKQLEKAWISAKESVN